MRVTDPTFAEGSVSDFYVHFELPEGHFTAVGRCTVMSTGVPRPGLVLVSCGLKLTEFPKGYVGGIATSSSVFNVKGVPGYNTGSLWTLSVFEPEPSRDTHRGQAPVPGIGESPARGGGN